MAAAAAGTGTWAAQEKQFPPALLSFFIYNPRFGPREGEVTRRGRPRRPWGGRARGGGGSGPSVPSWRDTGPARPVPGRGTWREPDLTWQVPLPSAKMKNVRKVAFALRVTFGELTLNLALFIGRVESDWWKPPASPPKKCNLRDPRKVLGLFW
jgi:hypothetical protein